VAHNVADSLADRQTDRINDLRRFGTIAFHKLDEQVSRLGNRVWCRVKALPQRAFFVHAGALPSLTDRETLNQ
jgi:hypothetical protein